MFYLRSNEGKSLEEIEEEIRRKELLEQQALTADIGAITAPEIPAYVPITSPSIRTEVPASAGARAAIVNQAIERRQTLPFTPAPAELMHEPTGFDPNESVLAQMQRRASGESLGERYARENQSLNQQRAIDRFAGDDSNLAVDSFKRFGHGASEVVGHSLTAQGRLAGLGSTNIGGVITSPGAMVTGELLKQTGEWFERNSLDPSFQTTPIGTFEDWKKAEGIKEATIAALKLAGNEAPRSLAYMSFIMASVPTAFMTFLADVERIAGDRAKNDDRDPDAYTFGDVMAVAPSAAVNIYLERFIGKVAAGQIGKIPFATRKTAQKLLNPALPRATLVGGGQAIIEGAQEVSETAASRVGTKRPLQEGDLQDAGIAGMLTGGPMGSALSATGSALGATQNNAAHGVTAENIINDVKLTANDEAYLNRITKYIQDRHPDVSIDPNSHISDVDGYTMFEYGKYDEITGAIESISPKDIIGGTKNYDDAIKRIARTIRHETIHAGVGREEDTNPEFLLELYTNNKDTIDAWAASNPAYSHLLEGEGSINQAKLANEALANAGEVDITFTGKGMVYMLGLAEKMGIPINSNDSMRVIAQKVYGNVPSKSYKQRATIIPERIPSEPTTTPLVEEVEPDIEVAEADATVAEDRDIDLEAARAETDKIVDKIHETLEGVDDLVLETVRTAGLSAAAAVSTEAQIVTRNANDWVAKQGLKMMETDAQRQQLKIVQRLWGQPLHKLMGEFPGTLTEFKKIARAISQGDMQYVEDAIGGYLDKVAEAKAARMVKQKETKRKDALEKAGKESATRNRINVPPSEATMNDVTARRIVKEKVESGEFTKEEGDLALSKINDAARMAKGRNRPVDKRRYQEALTGTEYVTKQATLTKTEVEQREIDEAQRRLEARLSPVREEPQVKTTSEENQEMMDEFRKLGGKITQVEANDLEVLAQKKAFMEGTTEKRVVQYRTEQLEQLTGFEMVDETLSSAEAKVSQKWRKLGTPELTTLMNKNRADGNLIWRAMDSELKNRKIGDDTAYIGSDFQYTPKVAPEMEGLLDEWKADPEEPTITEGTVQNAAYDFLDWPEGDIANRVGLLDGSTKVRVIGEGDLIGGYPSIQIATDRLNQAPITHYVPTKRIKILPAKWKELVRDKKVELWKAHIAEQLGDKTLGQATRQEKLDLLKSWWKRDNPEQMPDRQKRALYEAIWGSSGQVSKLVKAMNLGSSFWSKQHHKALDAIFTPEFIAGATLDNVVALDTMGRNNLFIEPGVMNTRSKNNDAANQEGTTAYLTTLWKALQSGTEFSAAHMSAALAAAKVKGYLTSTQQAILKKYLKANKTGDVGALPDDVRRAYMKSLEVAAMLNNGTILNPAAVEGLVELTGEAQGFINSSMEQIKELKKAKKSLSSAEAKKRDDDYDTKALQTHFTSQTALALFRFLVSKPASDVGAFNRESFLGRGNKGDVPAASIIQNIIFSDFSSQDRPAGMEDRLDMTQQVSARTGEFATELGMIFSKLTNRLGVIPPNINAEVMSYLSGKDVDFSSPEVETAAKETKVFLEKVYQYAKDRTKGLKTPLDLRGAGDTVIPRVWNVDYIATSKGKSKFLEAIVAKFTDPDGKSILEDAGISPEELYVVVVNSGGYVQGDWRNEKPSQTTSKKEIDKNLLIQEYLDSLSTEELIASGLVVDKIQALVPAFFNKAVTRVEYAAVFGANNELLNQWINLGVEQIKAHNTKVLGRGEGASGTLIDEKLFRKTVFDMSEILRNKYGYDKADMPTRKMVQIITNFETIVKLPLVTIASFPEIFTHAIPFGLDPKTFATDLIYATVFAGYKGMSGISKLVFNKHLPAMLKRADEMEGFMGDIRLLQELGISDPTGFGNDGAVTRYGNASFMAGGLRAGGAKGTLAGKIPPNVRAVFNMKTYMQATMLTTLTEMQQFMALRNYQRNMHKRLVAIRDGTVKGDKLKQYTQDLLDYGITPDIDLSTPEGEAQFKGGAIRFVNRVITKPSGANTARVFKNPLTAPLVLFERFITTYGNTLLAATARNFADKVNNVERAKQAGHLIVAGVGMYGAVVFGEILRGAIKGTYDEDDFEIMPKDLETLVRRADRMAVGGAPGAFAGAMFFPGKAWYGDTGQNRLVRELGPVGGDFANLLNYLMSDKKGQEQFIRLMGQVVPMSKQILPKPKKKKKFYGKSYADSFK